MLFVSMTLMGIGTLLMINKKESNNKVNKTWLVFAILSSIFASLVSLFVKIGLQGIPSSLGTLIRTIIVFIFTLFIVLFRKDYKEVNKIDSKSWLFLTVSGFATGLAWLCEYESLNIEHTNPVAINAIGKFSILLTMTFSYFVLHEKMKKKELLGLVILTIGILLITIFSL